MRLWSVHPRYLDSIGLVAVWREALLAKAVLQGMTKGYTHHPQLERFASQPRPVASVDAYLKGILDESLQRGYRFDASKVGIPSKKRMSVTEGQLRFERAHLMKKLDARGNKQHIPALPEPHPLFAVRPGPMERWERSR